MILLNPTGIKHTHCDKSARARARTFSMAKIIEEKKRNNKTARMLALSSNEFFCWSFSGCCCCCRCCIRLISYLLFIYMLIRIGRFFSFALSCPGCCSLESDLIHAKRANEPTNERQSLHIYSDYHLPQRRQNIAFIIVSKNMHFLLRSGILNIRNLLFVLSFVRNNLDFWHWNKSTE